MRGLELRARSLTRSARSELGARGRYDQFWDAAAHVVVELGVASADHRAIALYAAQPVSCRRFTERAVDHLRSNLEVDAALPLIPSANWVEFQFMP